MLEEAARSNMSGVIFTMCYDPNEDEKTLSQMITLVESSGGLVHLVQLTCPEAVLFERIGNESRKPHDKIITQEKLRMFLDAYELFMPYKLRNSLTIDTSIFSVVQSVETILSALGLMQNNS